MTERRHWFKAPDSLAAEPWSNDVLALCVRLQGHLNTRWARDKKSQEERGKCSLTRSQLCALAGCERFPKAEHTLRILASYVSLSFGIDRVYVSIEWPKYAEYQRH